MRYRRDGFSVEAAKKKKRTLPDDHWYLNPPPVVAGVDFYYEAFRDMVTERKADGPIPWSRVMAYADRKGLAPDVADTLWAVLRRMDDADRAWRVEQLGSEGGDA